MSWHFPHQLIFFHFFFFFYYQIWALYGVSQWKVRAQQLIPLLLKLPPTPTTPILFYVFLSSLLHVQNKVLFSFKSIFFSFVLDYWRDRIGSRRQNGQQKDRRQKLEWGQTAQAQVGKGVNLSIFLSICLSVCISVNQWWILRKNRPSWNIGITCTLTPHDIYPCMPKI